MKYYLFVYHEGRDTLESHPRGGKRVAGRLYKYKTKKTRDESLNEGFRRPASKGGGFYLAVAIEENDLPDGWRADDAVRLITA